MDTKANDMLKSIKEHLERLWPVIDFFNVNDKLSDYSSPVLEASRIVEQMIILLAYEEGFDLQNNQFINITTGEPLYDRFISPLLLGANGSLKNIPEEIRVFLNKIRRMRNVAAHPSNNLGTEGGIQYGEAVMFADAFDCFVSWFVLNSKTLRSGSERLAMSFMEGVRSLSHRLTINISNNQSSSTTPEIYSLFSASNELSDITETNKQSLDSKNEEVLEKLSQSLSILESISSGVINIERKVDHVAEKLDVIATQISGYQSLLTKQIELAVSEEEIDRIVSAYADECSSRITREVNGTIAEHAYNIEKEKLIQSLGDSAWNKLDGSSKDFLITAKITYNSLLTMKDVIDYSGVCLPVTKAVELEMSNRFCRDYVLYLKNRYPGNDYSQYPISLLNRYDKPMKPKEFTLGTVAFVLSYNIKEGCSEEQIQINHDRLMEYVSEKLMKGKSKDEIEKVISFIAEGVEDIRKDYRNPSAHTNQLQSSNAKQCFDLVIDIEKLLKTILDALDY